MFSFTMFDIAHILTVIWRDYLLFLTDHCYFDNGSLLDFPPIQSAINRARSTWHIQCKYFSMCCPVHYEMCHVDVL